MFVLLGISMFLQLSLHEKAYWHRRWWIIPLIMLFVGFVMGELIVDGPKGFALLLITFVAFRLFNVFRIVVARLPEARLRRMTYHTGLWLVASEMVTLVAWGVTSYFHVPAHWWLDAWIGAQLALALGLGLSSLRSMKKSAPLALSSEPSNLPSLTVAIPARNEDAMLEACLRSVLASDYPKLEVLVLDDCSHDRTPEIIRSFAHDGARFVPGEEASGRWLPKNMAYDTLAHEASGELILFCGVDARFKPSSFRQLVATMQHKQKLMLSILPVNHQREKLPLTQALRYYWELAPPRRLFHKPPVLSTCWLIKKELLTGRGGFSAVRSSISPEAYFAEQAASKHDGYSFRRSDKHLGVVSLKSASEQRATAIRRRYPRAHHRPELVAYLCLLITGLLLPPFVLVFALPFTSFSLARELAVVLAAVITCASFALVTHKTFPKSAWRAWLAFPLALVVDLRLLLVSMCKYEFSSVIWKGRNVCQPSLRAIKHLPKLS